MLSKDNKNISIDDIVRAYKSCDDEKKKRALYLKIVENTLELVKKIATPIAVQTSMPTEDLLQVGALGLIKAIEFYEVDKNAKFETYANYFIKGEIRHYVRDKAGLIKTPRKVQEFLFKLNSARKALLDKGIDEPTDEDLAEYMNVSVQQVRDVMRVEQYKSLISLDQAVSPTEDDEISLLEKIPSGDSKAFWEYYEDKLMLSSILQKLSPELRDVIEMSFYQDLNQREIAERLNISQMQVSRRLKKALSKMYELIRRN